MDMDKIQRDQTLAAQIKRAAAEDLRCSKYSLPEISAALAALTGRSLADDQIGAYVDPSTPHRFPLDLLPAWVRVTGSRRLLDLIEERI
jgi:hypothetical protein